MAVNFLKDVLNKNSTDEINRLTGLTEKLKRSGFKKDERYWEPVRDKGGNGFAIIRFLPEPDGENAPFVRLYTHGIKGTNGWYIENSPQTLEQPCPASELFFQVKAERGEEAARKISRKVYYISNILVVMHPARKEDEGKVFLFKYGTKIFNKLGAMMNPKEPGLTAINPFDLLTGANFRLRVKMQGDWPNYDDCAFDQQSPISDDPEFLEKIWNNEYSLAEEVAPDKFKSYDVLKAKLYKVLGIGVTEETLRHVQAPPIAPAQETADERPPWEEEKTESAPGPVGKIDYDARLELFQDLASDTK